MSKQEPKFMQRCADCRKVIMFYDESDPELCKRCFKTPRRPVKVVVEVRYNFENSPPAIHAWKEEL